MTDAKLQAMTKRFKGWKGKVTKYWSEKLGESIKVGNWVRKVSPSSDKVENQVKVSKCRIESIWKVRNQVREKTCCYVSSHSAPILPSRRQTWKALVHNICPDPSMAFFWQSFCSQYMSRPLHGALLLVCSQDASGFLHLGVASYPSPSSHILTQNLCPSETVSYLENISIFSGSELVMRAGNRFWWQ